MSPRALLAAAAVALLLAPAGAAATSIPSAKLALMPLPQSAYGKEGATLAIDSEGGVSTNAEVAEDTGDKNDTAASLKRLGRITGYEVIFGNFGAIGSPGRLVFVASDVELFRDGRAAARGFERNMRDTVADDPSVGVEMLSAKTFAVRGIGDRAVGARLKARFGKVTVWMTGVQLRVGELLASVAVMRTDSRSQNAHAVALARALEARIGGVLAGRVTTPPVKTPSKGQQGPKTVKPKVDIAVAVPTSGDVSGAKVVRQGHVADDASISTYEREFGSVRYGSSRLLSIQTGASLLATAAQAKAAVVAAPSVLKPGSAQFRQELTAEFAKDGGLQLEKLTVLRQGPATFGGGSAYDVTMRIETAIGAFDVAYVFVAKGRFLGYLTLISEYGTTLARADVARMTGKFADRMGDASKKLAAPVA